ncbi:MAG: Crp/Fnr family transcriptional regulator [Pseudomonadota bacterium]
MDKTELLRRCFLFAGADARAIDALAARAKVRKFNAGVDLMLEGEGGGVLYIIESGLVRVWLSEPDNGKQLTLAFLEVGDVVGEIALLDGQPRTASATAVEDSVAVAIERKDFFDLVRTVPDFAEHVFELVCERFRQNVATLNAFAFYDLKKRLASKLIELAMSHGRIDGQRVTFSRRFSQLELAQLLGVTREAVNRQLSAWTKHGVVKINDGRLEILDLAALKAEHGLG